MRYSVSNDNIIYVGSETGMVRVDESKIVEKGRLGPGDIIGINLKEGKIYRNSDLKDYLAKEAPYEEYVKKIIRLDKRVTVSRETTVIETEKLRKRMIAAGFTMEELELILHPMVSDAKESTGSMGDDTPVAVLSDKYRPLSHFFRQKFSQVTNPPIDSLREQSRMSLKTRFGNLQDILSPNPYEENVFVIDSPFITNGLFKKISARGQESTTVIDCTVHKDNFNLKEEIKRIQFESETAVLSGKSHIVLSDIVRTTTNYLYQ